jgi:exodeoxyribonuclease VII large subunit
MLARLLPAPETFLAVQRQRCDDVGERLGRALRHRLTVGQRQLADAGGALRPALLRQRAERDRGRLDALRLRPETLQRQITERRNRLEATWRLALSLDPRRPLERGFAMVSANGRLITGKGAAQDAGAMTLTFRDGSIDVAVSEGLEPNPIPALSSLPKRARRNAGRGDKPGQHDLFTALPEKE